MENKAIITTDILTDTSPVAVLQVNSNKEFEFSATDTASSSTSSGRSSMSSFDSNHDHTAPLELGLIINALQTSLTEQQQDEEEKEEEQLQHKQPQMNNATALASAVVNQQVESLQSATILNVLPSTTFGSKGLKREEAVIVDYELDHGVNNTPVACEDSSATGSANLIVLDCIDTKSVKPNNLTPREQEKAGKVPLDKSINIR